MLTVAIITCNRKEQFAEAVISCEKHVKNIEWELVIVDNHSTDGTQKWTENHFKNNLEILKYLYMDKNCGVAGARNIAFSNAKGDIVYFLDDDAIIEGEEDCLDQAYLYMRKKADAALMGTYIYDHKINGPLNSIPQKNKELDNGTLMMGFIGASHFINKKLLGDIILYPEFIFYGGEELYLSITVYDKNYNCYFYNDLQVQHYPSTKTRLSASEMKMSLYCNAYKVRMALFPKEYRPLVKLFYYVNVFRGFKFNRKDIVECNNRIKNFDVQCNKISHNTIKKLVGLFGIVKVFK